MPTRHFNSFVDYRASVRPVEGTDRDGDVSGSHRPLVAHAFTALRITDLQVLHPLPAG